MTSRYLQSREEGGMWDPDQYQQFGDERSRPFFELVGRVGAADPAAASPTSAAGPAS